MTHISNDPGDFAADMLRGYASAYARYVSSVPGAGVVNARARPGLARVVVGGGGGHFPWSAGFVGPGMADGAVMGDVFTSPSAEQIRQVVRALPDAHSVLFCYGNYAGDVLHFSMAQEQLRAEGVDCRSVQVTDDVASGGPGEHARRRGIAGSMIVYKIAGAAAAGGAGIDDVERIARSANACTRSFGVAFAGCTLPGRKEPLFQVIPGMFELGLGIHGEPGVRSAARMTARDLAQTLVTELVGETPPGVSGRAAVVLNGLGSTSHDELFVLWSNIAPLLTDAGIEPVLPEVGEYVTSLDMAGCSLSICWLDEEIDKLWSAAADTPSFRRDSGTVGAPMTRTVSSNGSLASFASRLTAPEVPSTDDNGSAVVRSALAAMLAAITEAEDTLGRLDSVAGDGDHGTGMTRGLRAAVDAAAAPGSTPGLLRAAGAAWANRGAGTSGALWGLMLISIGDALNEAPRLNGEAVSQAIERAATRVREVGGARLGDKTMVDALVPFSDALSKGIAAGEFLGVAWSKASTVAIEAAKATAKLRPQVGRARPLAERSLGSPDPGAVSMALCLGTIGPILEPCE